jgi:hypothetical protein
MSLTDSATQIREPGTPIPATPMPGARVPATLVLDVRGRRGERWLSALTLLAVACSALLLPFPPLQAALFFTVAALTVLAGLWWHGWLGGARRLVQLNWLADGRWLLADAGQGGFPAILSRHCRVGSRWLWLHWHRRAAQARRSAAPGLSLPSADSCADCRYVTMIFDPRHAFAQRMFRIAYVAPNFRAAHQSMGAVVAFASSGFPPVGQGARA